MKQNHVFYVRLLLVYLQKKIKNFNLKDLKKTYSKFLNIKKTKKIKLPTKFKEFNKILNKKSLNRISCVILPMEALCKAFRIN